MKRIVILLYILTICLLTVWSYGFLDLNLSLTHNSYISSLLSSLREFGRSNRQIMTVGWLAGLIVISLLYVYFLRYGESIWKENKKSIVALLLSVACLLSIAYPAHSYDLFNYITTARVTFHYQENPYIVMPIEFLGDPYLLFTRAANKLALYGPLWIFITAIPHYMGMNNIWLTIITFKLTNAIVYLLFSFIILRITKSIRNVIYFALNPLVIMEVLVSGHNDLYMMILAMLGLYLWEHHRKILGGILFLASWCIKGATVMLLPVLFIKHNSWEKMLHISYWILLSVFFVVAPLREELYPWYAVWFISTASLLNIDKHIFIYWLTIVLSFSLELRHLPYMWMGYYEGPGPMLRMAVTIIPVVIFLFIYYIFPRSDTVEKHS